MVRMQLEQALFNMCVAERLFSPVVGAATAQSRRLFSFLFRSFFSGEISEGIQQ